MPDEKFKQSQIDKEYLNFDKYEKNSVSVEDYNEIEKDDGAMKNLKKFQDVLKTLDVPEADQYHDEEMDLLTLGMQNK